MFLLISVLFLIKTVESVDIVQRPNGYFITGKGCGTTNPIRYLTQTEDCFVDNQYDISILNGKPARLQIKTALHARHSLTNI